MSLLRRIAVIAGTAMIAATAAGCSVYTPASLSGVDLSGAWESSSGMWFIIGPGQSMTIDPNLVGYGQVPYTASGQGGFKVQYTTGVENSISELYLAYRGNNGTANSNDFLQFGAYEYNGKFSLCGIIDPDDACQAGSIFTKVAN